ncbi:hypothetical protein [Paenibacillus alvei]|nr:hypothetical protein [Paenibacillus alvei]
MNNKPLFLPYEYGGLSEPIRRQRNDIELGQSDDVFGCEAAIDQCSRR